MKACIECLPCLGKNAVDSAKRSTANPEIRKKIVTQAFQVLSKADFSMSPPYYARKILNLSNELTGQQDLYGAEKRKSNELAEKLLLELPNIPQYNPDDFESRIRLAIAGNILDFGIYCDLDIASALEVVKQTFAKPLDSAAVKRVKERMDSAEKILYVLDNCGEAVFDRVFMEPYREKIVLGIRGCAVFNDVTRDDLADCGLEGFTQGVVSNGPEGYPGVIIQEAPDEFLKEFNSADLIVSKGQGNFETLSDSTAPIAFLFLAKCPVVLREIGAELHSIQVRTINF
jgi:hypothetical protein